MRYRQIRFFPALIVCPVLLLMLFLCPSSVQAASGSQSENAGSGVEPAQAGKLVQQAGSRPISEMISSSEHSGREGEAVAPVIAGRGLAPVEGAISPAGGQTRAPVMISSSSHGEREGEAPAALLSEGATRAPATEREVTSNPAVPIQKSSNEYGNVTEEVVVGGEGPQIADPIEPWNRAMYHVNDKLYFWVIKPAATGYTHALPEDVRNLFSNFYRNIKAPIRIVNNFLQGKPKYAGIELTRFAINSVVGVGGLRDCAKECFGIDGRNADFGQTLGKYGVGFGFYIVWPVLGPSSPRDTVGLVADRFLTPQTYIVPESTSPEGLGISAHEMINNASFHLGDYEALKGAAIDPYIAMRDAYVQFRKKLLEQ